jgi:hypothetical protein
MNEEDLWPIIHLRASPPDLRSTPAGDRLTSVPNGPSADSPTRRHQVLRHGLNVGDDLLPCDDLTVFSSRGVSRTPGECRHDREGLSPRHRGCVAPTPGQGHGLAARRSGERLGGGCRRAANRNRAPVVLASIPRWLWPRRLRVLCSRPEPQQHGKTRSLRTSHRGWSRSSRATRGSWASGASRAQIAPARRGFRWQGVSGDECR